VRRGGFGRAMRRSPGPFVAVVVLVATLAGCTAARDTLGTSSSPCFRALPVASEAVNDRGTLAGVRLLGARDLEKHPKLRDALSTRAGHPVRTVCAVAFTGQFRIGEVHDPIAPGPVGGIGTFAVVCISTPQNGLLGTLVLSRAPLPFRHNVQRHEQRSREGSV
jgi:hypothetical protein